MNKLWAKLRKSFFVTYIFCVVAAVLGLGLLGVLIKSFAMLGGTIFALLGVTYGT